MKKILLIVSMIACGAAGAQTDLVGAMKKVSSAKPGDTIVVSDGIYRDVEISLVAKGDSAKPIVVKAQTPGKVIISGQSSLRIAGTGIEVNGFLFANGYAPKGAVIEFRSGAEVANNCRVTNCAIDDFNPPNREVENSWVLLYGKRNRFDHNNIRNKLNHGVTLAVILDEDRNTKNYHSIDHNYFGKRPNLGSNGGETIRVGTSQSSLLSSYTSIADNLFEHCDGEVEVVSIKSCDNQILRNTFYESAGVLALRHGHRNIVRDNVFVGNSKPFTGGIRVINEGHTITGNEFYDLKGDRFFAALAVMNAVPNSLPNRYHQVKDVVIENNKWINCDYIELCVGKDNERTLPPANVLMKNNIFFNKQKNSVFTAYDDISGFRFVGNKAATKSAGFKRAGFETLTNSVNTTAKQINRSLYAAGWYQPMEPRTRVLSGKIITASTAQNGLADAVLAASFGDVIELPAEGEYLLDKPLEIKTYLHIRSAAGLKTKPVIRYNGTRGRVAIFTIMDDGILELDGLAFNHEALPGKASASSTVSPAPVMRGHYSAFINNCEFYNLQESSYAPFKAQKSTYADTLIFTNCLFRDMSGDAIGLAAEKDDAGKYSAEYVEIKNCAFYKVLGYAVDLYRGGSDESTTGPTILVDHCVLEDVNNKERGSGMRLHGVQNVTVRNTSCSNTGRGGASIRFDEASWDKIAVTHCNFFNSGRVVSFWGKVITGPVFAVRPAYQAAQRYDFTMLPSSALFTKGTGGKPIGILPSNSTNTNQKQITKSTK